MSYAEEIVELCSSALVAVGICVEILFKAVATSCRDMRSQFKKKL